jgi:hypothetical protein
MSNDCTPTGNKRFFTKLLGLQYKVVYKKGTENGVADALSRKTDHEDHCADQYALHSGFWRFNLVTKGMNMLLLS